MAVRGGWGAGAAVELLFTWIEVEVRGFPDLLEGLRGLREAVMATSAVGEWWDGSFDPTRQVETLSWSEATREMTYIRSLFSKSRRRTCMRSWRPRRWR